MIKLHISGQFCSLVISAARLYSWHLVLLTFSKNLVFGTGLSDIRGIMYANVDVLCRFLSSPANKSGTFLTEQKQNMRRIKGCGNVRSRGVNLLVTFNARPSKLICRCGCEDNPLSSCFCQEKGRKKKSGLISVNVQNWLDCDQVKQSRLQTVRKNSPETSLKVCCRYW